MPTTPTPKTAQQRKPKDTAKLDERNNAIIKKHSELFAKYQNIYRATYIIELVAKEFYLSDRQVYKILQNATKPEI